MQEQFHPAVQLLLSRMKSHPEEFSLDDETLVARWDWPAIMKGYGSFMTEAEKAALLDAMRPIALEELHHGIMRELLSTEPNVATDVFVKSAIWGPQDD